MQKLLKNYSSVIENQSFPRTFQYDSKSVLDYPHEPNDLF